jgi:ABC-type transport system substrate-binding protein/PAS domain-containing protein/two-component sensor histidine kinase
MAAHQTRARVALYSVDPPALTFFQAFDPDTFVVVSAVHDALIYIDNNGDIQPGLATRWWQVDPLTWELELRRGVRFHDGSPFEADSVIETFRAHFEPTPSPAGRGIFSIVESFEALAPFQVRIRTRAPDALFMRRLFTSHVSPGRVLRAQGRDALAAHPIGTGPYRFISWERNRVIRLERNREHWAKRATVDELDLVIAPQKEWVEHLQEGTIDVALNIDTLDAERLRDVSGVHVEHARAALSHWFLLTNRGPLRDEGVRRALNHAVHRGLLVDVAEHGRGIPQRAIATQEQEGYAPDVPSYAYDPELARRLLAQAGYPEGFALRGLVSETSSAIYLTAREFLARVGVKLEAEIVPRCEWMARVGSNVAPDVDFAVANIDNPVVHGLFHHFVLLFSQGPQTILRDPEYDARFLAAAAVTEPEAARAAQVDLERYVAERALILFTVQAHVYVAARSGFSAPLPRSGHFDTEFFLGLAVDESQTVPTNPTRRRDDSAVTPAVTPDLARLALGTCQQGVFYLPPGEDTFTDAAVERVWRNVLAAQDRWNVQVRPMLRELVTSVEARSGLASVLGSTNRVGIVGFSDTSRRLFVNQGYPRFVSNTDLGPEEVLGAELWKHGRATVDTQGSFVGRVAIVAAHRAASCPAELILTITRAQDGHGGTVGYTLVFADFSGEEERIRSSAIRTILDHVPYGLLVSDRHGRVAGTTSRACAQLFATGGRSLEGRSLVELLELPPREAECFELGYLQIFDDILPEELSLDQLPSRVKVRDRHLRLSASLIRDAAGQPESLLFSILDVSAQVCAEEEQERMDGVITVLRHQDNFTTFVRSAHVAAERLLAEAEDGRHRLPAWQEVARRELHTWKGLLGLFHLHAAARTIHVIENELLLTPEHVQECRAAIDQLVDQNASIWRLDLDGPGGETRIPAQHLQALRRLIDGHASVDDLRAGVGRFVDAVSERSFNDALGPIEEAVARLGALHGKSVELVLGTDIKLPGRLAPAANLVIHLVRNAVAHGIETGTARGEKPARGTIRIAASRDATTVTIDVSDDGAGVSVERVVARAIERGLISSAEAAGLSFEQGVALILRDGLSTTDGLSETSGRGVGLSAVADGVRRLGGTLQISSELGKGASFRLTLPLASPGTISQPDRADATSQRDPESDHGARLRA